MTEKFIPLTETFYVSAQLSTEDVKTAAANGFTLIAYNRPDGEMLGQPTSAEIEAAANVAGLAYVHIPVDARGISMSHISALNDVLNVEPEPKTLAFCRSGMRSTIVYAYWAAANGQDPDAIVELAAAAGYDIRGQKPALVALGQTKTESP